MEERPYDKVLLFMGIMSVKGFPDSLKERLEERYGKIAYITEPFDFDFTSYYIPEMGEGIKRFFIAFERLVSPDCLSSVKCDTNEIEKYYSENGKRKINIDPGTISEANLILATTKNRSHRIAIGNNLFAEVTLIYQNHGWKSFDWTYSDYRSERVQQEMLEFRKVLLKLRKLNK